MAFLFLTIPEITDPLYCPLHDACDSGELAPENVLVQLHLKSGEGIRMGSKVAYSIQSWIGFLIVWGKWN